MYKLKLRLSFRSVILSVISLAPLTGCQHLSQYFGQQRSALPETNSNTFNSSPTRSKSGSLVVSEASYQGILARSADDFTKLGEERPSSQELDEVLFVKAQLTLTPQRDQASWPPNALRPFTLQVPSMMRERLTIGGDCQPSHDATKSDPSTSSYYQIQCRRSRGTESAQAKLELTYTIPWNFMRGHDVIIEGERQYHLNHLVASLGGEVWLGFSRPGAFLRTIQLKALESLRLTGHEISGVATLEERVSPQARSTSALNTPKTSEETAQRDQSKELKPWRELIWRNSERGSGFSTFFTFGSWETPHAFKLQVPRRAQLNQADERGDSPEESRESGEGDRFSRWRARLLTPLGSRFYRVGKMSLRRLQTRRIQALSKQLQFNALYARSTNRPLLWITLPDHPNYIPPDLRRHGVIFMDESWFALDAQHTRSLTVHEQLKLYENLYVALGATLSNQSNLSELLGRDPRLLHALARWSTLNHLTPAESQRESSTGSPSLTELYKLEMLHLLRDLAGERYRPLDNQSSEEFSHILGGTFTMLQAWLGHTVSKARQSPRQLRDRLGQLIKDAPLKESSSASLQEIGRQLNRLDSHLKPIFESFLSNQGLPLVHVKWSQQDKGDRVEVRFTLSQRPFMPHERQAKLKPEMWIIPVCLRLGIRDNPSRVHCVFLDQPERSDYELSLEAPLLWVHPNADQSGLYLWSLEDVAFDALLSAESLGLVESLSLVEMSSILLETSLGNPHLYLKAVEQLSRRAHDPLSITHLFKHLNQVVLYFGERGDQVGAVERWASGILQGVMSSQPRFSKPPLNQFTQLQIAQWDREDAKVLFDPPPKKTQKMIRRFLSPTTSQASFEDDVVKVDLETIQYPLLISTLFGDQKLWDKLRYKLAESEGLPLVRLVVIRALVQFIEPQLLHKTLQLLTLKLNELTEVADPEESENPENSGEQTGQGDSSSKDPQSAQGDDQIDDQADDQAEESQGDDRESTLGKIPLRAEDALELVRLIRSHRARKLAWDWLIAQKTPIEELIHYGGRGDIQEGVLRWASAVCDVDRLAELKSIYQGRLGFRQSTLLQHRMYLSAAQRCVKVRRLRPAAEQFAKMKLQEKP